MPKIKFDFEGIYADDLKKKAKYRHSNRRKETFNKKNTRINNCDKPNKNSIYNKNKYTGYYLKEGVAENRYKYEVVPEHEIVTEKYNGTIRKVNKDDPTIIDIIPIWIKKIVKIPAHIGRKWIRLEHIKFKAPKLKRRSTSSKKYYKRRSNSLIRQSDEVYKGGDYKKIVHNKWN